MIQKIYKGSDIMVALSLKDAEGTPYRISTTNEFTIRFFTTDPDTYIEGSILESEEKKILITLL